MTNFLRENAIRVAISLVFVLILAGASLSFYNRYAISNSLLVQTQTESVKQEIERIHDNIRFMDISGRGYALIRKPQFLFWTVDNARKQSHDIFQNLDSLFKIQGFEDPNYQKLKTAMNNYTDVFSQMIGHLEKNDTSAYLTMLKFDYGKQFYVTFEPFLKNMTDFESQLTVKAQKQYEAAVAQNQGVQLTLFIVGLPTLLWLWIKLTRDEKERRGLLLNLDDNNKHYVFDNGESAEKKARDILHSSIDNLKEASAFVRQISKGNYEVQWTGLSQEIAKLNKDNLAGLLVMMRDEMKRMKEEDQKRMWVTQGLSELSDIIRKGQSNMEELAFQVLKFLVKYANSQQGSLFVLKNEDQQGAHLELTACYAYERRKHISRQIPVGQGLVGQTYLEAQTILLKDIPKDYINITSGLGQATPGFVIIVPMKHNEKVLAIVEMASFNEYQSHQISFFEKAGEFVASALFTAEQNERNKEVMIQLRQQAEQLRSQEEELKQNIEELEATQETMRRQSLQVG